MKKFMLPLALALAVPALALAQAPAPEAPKPAEKAKATDTKPAAEKPAAKAGKTHKVEAEVVSADVEKKTLTFKSEGAEKTAPVGAMAVYRLKKVKAGDKVTLTCKDDDKGEHQEITMIRPAAAAAAKPAEKPAEKKPEAPKP
jgi:tRNA(Arg) A34 adenosine deaminase TadA